MIVSVGEECDGDSVECCAPSWALASALSGMELPEEPGELMTFKNDTHHGLASGDSVLDDVCNIDLVFECFTTCLVTNNVRYCAEIR